MHTKLELHGCASQVLQDLGLGDLLWEAGETPPSPWFGGPWIGLIYLLSFDLAEAVMNSGSGGGRLCFHISDPE